MNRDNPPAAVLPYEPEAIRSLLSTHTLGRRIELHRQVGSTNDLAREAGRHGEPEGLAILAEEQLAGRGRLGRKWVAPPGSCILCSVLLRPQFSPQQAFYLTVAASLAIYHACLEQSVVGGYRPESNQHPTPNTRYPTPSTRYPTPDTRHPTPTIKWPNDVLLGGRKVAGVLSEAEFRGGEWAFAVVGFGVNVNLSLEELGDLAGTATSLSTELGVSVDRALLLGRTLAELERLYLLLQAGHMETVYAQWVAALETIGRRVLVNVPGGGMIRGTAVRVDPDGALVIRTSPGIEERVLAGDVLPPLQP